MKRLPEVEELRRLFGYDKDTGVVKRLVYVGSKGTVGSVVGSETRCGYLRVHIKRQGYLLHRIVYKLHTGVDPGGLEIDHINGDGFDNRIANLRAVDKQTNMKNTKRSKLNTSGTTGVYFSIDRNKWQAQITVDDKVTSLGRFNNKEDAISARRSAEKKHGFHENHGRSF